LRRIPEGNQRRRFGVARRKKKASSRGEGGSVKVCSIARFAREKEKKRESTWPGEERQAAPACLTGRRGGRSGRLPDVEKRGAASAGDADGGRRSRATRGVRCRGAQSCRRRSGPGGGGGVQQGRK
jgi:hypothetical protein